jgi:tetratricopeptide (TPR) repeat protein
MKQQDNMSKRVGQSEQVRASCVAARIEVRWWLWALAIGAASWEMTPLLAQGNAKDQVKTQAPLAPNATTPALTSQPFGAETPRAANAINVLILALDDLAHLVASPAPLTAPAAQVQPATDTPAAPAAPETLLDLPAIAPAAWPLPGRASVEYRGVSKKEKPKKADKDAGLFLPLPEPPTSPVYIDRSRNPQGAAPTAGDVSPDVAAPSSALELPSTLPIPQVPDTSPLLLPASEPVATKPPGVAQAAAAPLRRALLRAGYTDVLTTAPDGSAIQRALNSRRLHTRTLDSLQNSVANLVRTTLAAPQAGAATPTQDAAPAQSATDETALAPVIQTAARVGQALGYRAVLVLGVVPNAGVANIAPPSTLQGTANAATGTGASYSLLLVDAYRDQGELIIFDETGAGEMERHEAAAATGAALVSKNVQGWPEISLLDKAQLANKYLADARALLAANDVATAHEKLNQVIALDPNRAEAHLLLGEALESSDPSASMNSYQRAVGLNPKDGETWAKMAIGFATSPTPDWPRAVDAGRRALAAGYDTAGLRQALATAQLGRAELFRKADRINSAEDAEVEARVHLDRAMELAPEDPGVARLIAKQLVQSGRYREAVRTLDRIAIQYPDDVEIQTQYATSLLEMGGREEDAFVAYARVWKLGGQRTVPVDAARYRKLSNGFDLRLSSLGKRSAQLAAGVAQNTMPRESALLQMTRYQEDMEAAITAIKVLQPQSLRQGDAIHASRIFAADLMSQALEAYQLYLETGQEIYRGRANEMHRQAIISLNAARTAY